MSHKKDFIEYPLVPRDFVTAPVFASKPQDGPRTVVVRDKIYTIGGFKPISEDRPACPALDIRHGRALFTILSFVTHFKEGEGPVVRFSINEFCKRYASTNGGRYSRDIKALLSDLERCWFKIEHENGEGESYRILKNISLHFKEPRRKPKDGLTAQQEIWFDEVELHPKFFDMLSDYMNIAQIHLKTLTAIRSPLAQAIYAYIPSRAVHSSKAKPFEITLQKLLTQVGHTVPELKSIRKKIFTQNKNPIIEQLDNVDIVNGKLRVELKETNTGDDYKLLFWAEKDERKKLSTNKEHSSVLKDLWVKSGRTVDEYYKRVGHPLPDLSRYQKEQMQRANVQLESNEVFFKQALALLGESVFDGLVADAKAAKLEGQRITKGETQRLIYYIKEAVERV